VKNLGTFEVKGDSLMVSDPCYSRGTPCHGVVDNVLPGKWTAKLGMESHVRWDNRCVAELEVVHKSFRGDKNYQLTNIMVGVDSGQAGIFDNLVYPEGDRSKATKYGRDAFYVACCNTTRNKPYGGVVDGGAVSLSGYGDGLYSAYTAKDGSGKVVAVKIVFIDEEALDEEGG